MRPAVLDASVLVRWVLSDRAHVWLDAHGDGPLLSLDFSLVESANALWKHAAFGDLPATDASECLDTLRRAAVDYRESALLLPAALEFALHLRHPFYDCLYIALATSEGADLVTCDRRLAAAAAQAGLADRVTLLEA